VRITGTVYRAHEPRFAFGPASGDGASRHGGRFNPVGLPALYTSLSTATALREAQQGFTFKPVTLCAYRVACDDVIDLTDRAVRAAHSVRPSHLACGWLEIARREEIPPSWRVAQRLIAAGFAGAIVPSFAPDATGADKNVVFWKWGSAVPHQVVVIDDDDRLPRNDLSWP